MTAIVSGDIVEFPLGPDVACIGEWSRAQDSMGAVVLLHDRNEDLDPLRPIARQFHKLRLDALLIDLPGHGLSGGSWDEHGYQAVEQAIAHCSSQTTPPPAVVAHGQATNLVVAQTNAGVSALVTIGPRLSAAELTPESPWRRIPMMAVVDPSDADAQRSQRLIQSWIRAWYLRLHIHYAKARRRDPTDWPLQVPTGSAAFAAEQIAYLIPAKDRQPPRERRAPSKRVDPEPGRSKSRGSLR